MVIAGLQVDLVRDSPDCLRVSARCEDVILRGTVASCSPSDLDRVFSAEPPSRVYLEGSLRDALRIDVNGHAGAAVLRVMDEHLVDGEWREDSLECSARAAPNANDGDGANETNARPRRSMGWGITLGTCTLHPVAVSKAGLEIAVEMSDAWAWTFDEVVVTPSAFGRFSRTLARGDEVAQLPMSRGGLGAGEIVLRPPQRAGGDRALSVMMIGQPATRVSHGYMRWTAVPEAQWMRAHEEAQECLLALGLSEQGA